MHFLQLSVMIESGIEKLFGVIDNAIGSRVTSNGQESEVVEKSALFFKCKNRSELFFSSAMASMNFWYLLRIVPV